jgi:hypothetical protein
VLNNIENTQRAPLPTRFSIELRNLVDFILTRGKTNTPTISQVLKTPIIFDQLRLIIRDFLPLTEKEETRAWANSLIADIVKVQCEVASTTYYNYRPVSII